jgi:hypothetical protein
MPAEDDEDLIGDAPSAQTRRRRGATTRAERNLRDLENAAAIEQALVESTARRKGKSTLGDSAAIHAGVTVTWLVDAFRMDIKTVRRKLAGVEPISTNARGAEVYDFREAASFLAKPPPDQVATFLRGMRVQDLPIHLQDPYWSAMRKQQIYMLHARQLWKTEDVLEFFGETFKTMKAAMQLWVDNLDAQTEITPEQRVLVTRMVDALQEDIHARLVEMPKHRHTGSLADSPEANPQTPGFADEDEDPVG